MKHKISNTYITTKINLGLSDLIHEFTTKINLGLSDLIHELTLLKIHVESFSPKLQIS